MKLHVDTWQKLKALFIINYERNCFLIVLLNKESSARDKNQKQPMEVLYKKKTALKNFAKFTATYQCRSLISNKVQIYGL